MGAINAYSLTRQYGGKNAPAKGVRNSQLLSLLLALLVCLVAKGTEAKMRRLD